MTFLIILYSSMQCCTEDKLHTANVSIRISFNFMSYFRHIRSWKFPEFILYLGPLDKGLIVQWKTIKNKYIVLYRTSTELRQKQKAAVPVQTIIITLRGHMFQLFERTQYPSLAVIYWFEFLQNCFFSTFNDTSTCWHTNLAYIVLLYCAF